MPWRHKVRPRSQNSALTVAYTMPKQWRFYQEQHMRSQSPGVDVAARRRARKHFESTRQRNRRNYPARILATLVALGVVMVILPRLAYMSTRADR